MKAIVQRAYGDSDVLSLEDVEAPKHGPDDVLIRVRASSINHADLVYMTGQPLIARLAFGIARPTAAIRGKDVAGTIEAVGSNVTGYTPGDEVYGELVAGGFAEYAVAPANRVAHKPKNLSFTEAATMPLAGMTALQAIRDAGGLQPGQSVLVNGASGGVGSFAVQVAVALGGDVTAVASDRNTELMESLGAHHVIDYTKRNFTQESDRYDVVLDLIGNHSLGALRKSLRPKGTLVLSSGTGSKVLGPMARIARAAVSNPFVSQTMALFTQSGTQATLDDLRQLAESEKLAPAIDRTYSLDAVPYAMDYFRNRHARGKIAVSI